MQKLKEGHFHFHHFGHVQNKSFIYRPGIYNLQTRTDLRYLKMLKTKKLNTINPQIKHGPCSKQDIQTRFVPFTDQKKTARKVTKN